MDNKFYCNQKIPYGAEVCFTTLDTSYRWGDLVLGKLKQESPFEVKIQRGTRFYDIAYYFNTSGFAISEKLAKIFEENNVTGWATYPLNIINCDRIYFGFISKGRCGPLIRPLNRGRVDGIKFDITTWDGSDCFTPDETSFVIFTSKVKDLLIKNNVRNIKMVDTDECYFYSSGGTYRKQ